MRIAVGTEHVKIISSEHHSKPIPANAGLVWFLLCLLATPVVAIWVGITSGLVTGLESALGVFLAGLVIGIKTASNKN